MIGRRPLTPVRHVYPVFDEDAWEWLTSADSAEPATSVGVWELPRAYKPHPPPPPPPPPAPPPPAPPPPAPLAEFVGPPRPPLVGPPLPHSYVWDLLTHSVVVSERGYKNTPISDVSVRMTENPRRYQVRIGDSWSPPMPSVGMAVHALTRPQISEELYDD